MERVNRQQSSRKQAVKLPENYRFFQEIMGNFHISIHYFYTVPFHNLQL